MSSCASSCCAKSCSDTTGPSEQARPLALCAPASSCLKALSMVSWYNLNNSCCCSASGGAGPSCKTGSHTAPGRAGQRQLQLAASILPSPLIPWWCAPLQQQQITAVPWACRSAAGRSCRGQERWQGPAGSLHVCRRAAKQRAGQHSIQRRCLGVMRVKPYKLWCLSRALQSTGGTAAAAAAHLQTPPAGCLCWRCAACSHHQQQTHALHRHFAAHHSPHHQTATSSVRLVSWWANNCCCLLPTKLVAVSPALRLPACVLVALTCCCFAPVSPVQMTADQQAKKQNSKANSNCSCGKAFGLQAREWFTEADAAFRTIRVSLRVWAGTASMTTGLLINANASP